MPDEAERPYERQMLSKGYLRGEKPAAKLYVHDEGFYADNNIELSAPDIFAAGDVAATWNSRCNTRIRVEHGPTRWARARSRRGNMLGQHTAYEKLPYFYSDQYDLGMEYNGYAADWDRVVVRGDLAEQEFLAFWVKDGRVLAGMNANVWDQGDDIKALIRRGATIDPERLADPSVPLADLFASPADMAGRPGRG